MGLAISFVIAIAGAALLVFVPSCRAYSRRAEGGICTPPRARCWQWPGLVALALCAVQAVQAAAASELAAPLADTHWRLVEFQSMDYRQGVTRPGAGTSCTMRLLGNGTVAMQLNCNRANGRWKAQPGSDAHSGQFEFGPLAATRAIFFRMGRHDFRATKQGDLHRIRVGNERYEIPDAVILGG